MALATDNDALLLQNLQDAGCDARTVERCMQLFREGEGAVAAQLLRRHRHSLVETLHICQNKIDCLDYLLFRLERETGQGGNET